MADVFCWRKHALFCLGIISNALPYDIRRLPPALRGPGFRLPESPPCEPALGSHPWQAYLEPRATQIASAEPRPWSRPSGGVCQSWSLWGAAPGGDANIIFFNLCWLNEIQGIMAGPVWTLRDRIDLGAGTQSKRDWLWPPPAQVTPQLGSVAVAAQSVVRGRSRPVRTKPAGGSALLCARSIPRAVRPQHQLEESSRWLL